MTPFEEMAEQQGLGAKSAGRWRLVAILALGQSALATALGAYVLLTKPPVVPYVYLVDENLRSLASLSATEWEPALPKDYITTARLWVRAIRSRPLDDQTAVAWRNEAQRITDRAAYRRIADLLKELDEYLDGHSGIEVSERIEALPDQVDEDSDTVVVGVRWRERKFRENGAGDWVGYFGKIKVQRVTRPETGQYSENPAGLYVTDYSFGQLGPDDELPASQALTEVR